MLFLQHLVYNAIIGWIAIELTIYIAKKDRSRNYSCYDQVNSSYLGPWFGTNYEWESPGTWRLVSTIVFGSFSVLFLICALKKHYEDEQNEVPEYLVPISLAVMLLLYLGYRLYEINKELMI